MDKRGKGLGTRFRLRPREPRQTSEHRVRLLEADVGDLIAAPGVPAQRRAAKPLRVVD
jgi:hypothetical protein